MAIKILALLACTASALKVSFDEGAEEANKPGLDQPRKGPTTSWSSAWVDGGDSAGPWEKAAKNRAQAMQKIDSKQRLVFIGDSIVDHWHKKTPQLWKEMFVDRYGPSHSSGIYGDGLPQLLWRLKHGENVPPAADPEVIMLHLGTNDVMFNMMGPNKQNGQAYGRSEEGYLNSAKDAYKAAIEEFQTAAPNARIVLTSVFPRDPSWGTGMSVYEKMIPKVNLMLAGLADNSKIYFADCTHSILNNGKIDLAKAPDALHPGYAAAGKGNRAWGECLQKTLDPLLLKAQTLGAAQATTFALEH